MVDEDEVEQTPHGGKKIRARAPERRPEVRFEPASADEPEDRALTGGVDPAHARAGLPAEGPARPPAPPTDATVEASEPDVPIVDARAVAKRLRERTRELLDRARAAEPGPADPAEASLDRPPAPPTEATVEASAPDIPLVDARAITDRFRERTRGLVDRVRSIEPPPAIVSRDGEEELEALDEPATDRPPVPPMQASEAAGPTRPATDGEPTEPPTEGFRVLRFGPPPPEEAVEPVPEDDGLPAVEPPGGELDRPPAPPTSTPVSATTIKVADQADDEGDETTSLLGRLRDSLPGSGDDEKPTEHEDEPPETGAEPEPYDEPVADHLGRPPAPPTATRDQESMVAVPDNDQDDPDETSEGTSGFLSRMKDRFSRDDEEETEPAPEEEAPEADEPEAEAEEEPAEADDAEDDGFFSRMRDRFSRDGEDEETDEEEADDEPTPEEEAPEADEPDEEPAEHEDDPIPEPPEEAEEPEDPEQPPEAPDEGEGDEETEEEPPVPEPALAADGDEGDPVPARPEADEPEEDQSRPDEEEPARPERTVDPGQAQPNGSADGPPEPGPAGADPVPARPTGTPTEPADESAIDPDELHETVDEVLERYRQPPPRLLREPRRR